MSSDDSRVPPFVSLLRAAYDEERHIEACRNCPRAQTWPAPEIVFVDQLVLGGGVPAGAWRFQCGLETHRSQ